MAQAMCTSFKVELLKGQHNFSAAGGHAFNIALFKAAAALGAGTTVYGATNEVGNTGSYSAGGLALTNVDPSSSGTTAMATFSANPSWSNVTFTDCTQALIYNTNGGNNRAVAVLDFGGNQVVTAGTFTINLPPVTSTTALLRFL
jgi:hypothetical protein